MFIHDLIVSWYGENVYQGLKILFYLSPIWMPLGLGYIFWISWVRYIRNLFFINTPMVVLEIRIPRDIAKSPVAMELVIQGLHQTGGESTKLAQFWEGKTRAWFSLELVSRGGEVKFYMWTRKNLKDLVEATIYSQYPTVEVREVEDYAKSFNFEPGKNEMWACHYEYTQKKYSNAFPIRTYMDYGLDENPKPEFETDPLATVIETLAAAKPGENMWLQIVIRAHKSEKRLGFFQKKSDWSSELIEARKEFLAKLKEEGRPRPSKEEERILDGIHRKLQKLSYDVGIRALYFADKKEVYNGGTTGYFRGIMKPFGANAFGSFEKNVFTGFNSLKPVDGTDFDYPWQDFKNIRVNLKKFYMLDAYKRRMFFYYPYEYKTMVMTTEELATLYHFPTQAVATPTLVRIESKRGQAPTNLPI